MQVFIKTIRFEHWSYFFLRDSSTLAYVFIPSHINDCIVYEVDTSGIKGYVDVEFQRESHDWERDLFMKASDVMHLIGDNT